MKDELFLSSHFFAVHLNGVFSFKFTFQKFLRNRIFDVVFKCTPKWSGSEIGIGALFNKKLLRFVSEF